MPAPIECDYDFRDTDNTLVEVNVVDSATGEIRYSMAPYIFQYRENDRHGYYYYRVPVLNVNGPQLLIVRVYTKDEPAILENPGVVFFRSK